MSTNEIVGSSSAEWHGDEYATANWADIDNEAPSFCMYGHSREEGATIDDQNSQDLQDLFGLHMLNPDSVIEQQMVHDEELQGNPQREDQWHLESIDENGPEPAFIQDVKALQCPDTSVEWKKRAFIVIFGKFILEYIALICLAKTNENIRQYTEVPLSRQ